MRIENACKKCKGDCCRHPWMTNEEYVRLVIKIGNKKATDHAPMFILGGWQFKQGEFCPGLTEKGCVLPYEDRPEACRIYPYVRIETIEGPKIFLDTSRCKHWKKFGEQREVVLGELCRK